MIVAGGCCLSSGRIGSGCIGFARGYSSFDKVYRKVFGRMLGGFSNANG